MLWDDIPWVRVGANGITFEVATAGNGNRLALLLHGFPEHAFSWRHQIPMLAELGFRCWAPNLRGYGSTDSPKQVSAYKLPTLIADIVGLIQASAAREVVLIGHDWGGALAWFVAMEHPELVQRLVIMNIPHPGCFLREAKRPPQLLKSWYILLFQLPFLPELLLGMKRGAGVARAIKRTCSNPDRFPDAVLDVYRRNAIRPGGLRAMLNWYRALIRYKGRQMFTRHSNSRVNCPTLLLWGDADTALSVRCTRGTDAYVPDLTLRILPGVSHWVQQDEPEAVNTMLRAWLSGAPVPEFKEIPKTRKTELAS